MIQRLFASVVLLMLMSSASAATVYGRAVGSFCCVLDMQGNMDMGTTDPVTGDITSSNGSTQFLIKNHDDALPPGTGNTAKVEWGTPHKKSNWTTNYFEFNGNGSDIGSALGSTQADSLFQIGTFDYYNAKTTQDNISSISFDLNMMVSNADESLTMMFPTLHFDFSINNTPDNNDVEGSKDSVSLVNALMLGAGPGGADIPIMGPIEFMFDGQLYDFILNGFAIIDPATGLPYTDVNGDYIFSTSTSAYENTLTQAAIYGTIQSASTVPVSTVPVPAAAWLFGSGLVGLITLARRKAA